MAFTSQIPFAFALGKHGKNDFSPTILMATRKTSAIACCMSPNNGGVSSMKLTPSPRTTTTSSFTIAEDLMFPAISTDEKPSKTVVQSNEGIGIINFLKGKRFLITGATGFLAKVLAEKMLRSEPDIAKIYVLVKAKDTDAAVKRLESEV